jgi:hypothetical protein
MWLQQYKELKRFIHANPSIEITNNSVSIPGDVRAEFYKNFDALRAGFIKDRFVIDLDRAEALSEAYNGISKTVKQGMHLEEIQTSDKLRWFLCDPLNGLMRTLFDPVFDLLKGRLDVDGFGIAAETAVKNVFRPLFAEGYQCWVTLALMQQLSADRLWTVKSPISSDNLETRRGIFSAVRDASPPAMTESDKLAFGSATSGSFLVPEAIVHTEKLQGYAGFVLPSNISLLKANSSSKKLEWLNQKQLKQEFGAGDFWPDLLFYVSGESADVLKMIADSECIARPVAIFEIMEDENWCYEKNIGPIIRHNQILTPSAGSYVISRTEVNPESFRQLCPPDNIHLINAGYDASRLEPLVSALAQAIASRKDAQENQLDAGEKEGG